ncbi:MAG: hypothetical protein WCO78_04415 [Candidatus Roizmanbacteria bacterium]
MSIILLILSIVLPAIALKKKRGYIYGLCFSTVLYFCFVTIWSIITQVLMGRLNHDVIQGAVLGTEALYIYFELRTKAQTRMSMSPYTLAAVTAIVAIFALSIVFNSIRLYKSYGSIPIVGTNDDNANHMAMTAAAIRGESLLFDNPLVKKGVNDGLIVPVTKWYPVGLYANTAHIYHVLKNYSQLPNTFDLKLVFDLFAVYIPLQLIIFLFLFFQVVDGTYASKSIASFIFLFTIGFFIILSEFYLKLYIYGFHAQLVGFNLILVLFIESREIAKRGHMSLAEIALISLVTISVGWTYFLFIPIAAVMYFLLHILLKRSRRNYVPYIAVVLSVVPLILFNLTQRIDSVNTTYGIAFISFTGLFVSLIGVLVCALMKEKKDAYIRTVSILVCGMTIIQMIMGASSFFTQTNNFGYYFFKSYWTIGFVGLPPLMAYISKRIDVVNARGFITKGAVTLITLMLSGSLFFAVFNQANMDAKGYDLLLHVANGYTNYFPYKMQKKWISLSAAYGDLNGQSIYVIGRWGQSILGYFVYGDSPAITKRLFQNGQWSLSKDTMNDYTSSIISDVYNKKSIHIIDNTELIQKYINYAADKKTKKMMDDSHVFDD